MHTHQDEKDRWHKAWEGVEQLEVSCFADGNVHWSDHTGQLAEHRQAEHMQIGWPWNATLWCISKRDIYVGSPNDTV